MLGRPVKRTEWITTSAAKSTARPVPALLTLLLAWSRDTIDNWLNGLLLNWYDGRLGHYIGRHRDSTKNMVHGAPIVTISFGEQRLFRLRQWQAASATPPVDLEVTNGSVLVMPYATNQVVTHEVRPSARFRGKRISVTIRAFFAEANVNV